MPAHPNDLLAHACLRHRFASGMISPWEFERDGEVVKITPEGPLQRRGRPPSRCHRVVKGLSPIRHAPSPFCRAMSSYVLSYASPRDPWWKRGMMRAIEDISGRRGLLPLYHRWSAEVAGKSPRQWRDLLELIDTRLEVNAPHWPAEAAGAPLVIVANHPFGIGDGIAILALAEQLGRPYRVLVHSDLMRIPELRPHALAIDFAETREAITANLRTRMEAFRLLREGVAIIVFPAGAVATADDLFGKAEELPWKTFTARLIQQAEASVLPVYFEGQNSALFHWVSRWSETLRLSLLVAEFRRFVGATVKAHVGAPVPFAELAHRGDRRALTEELYVRIQRLAPGAAGLPEADLKPTPRALRRRYPWDRPLPVPRPGETEQGDEDQEGAAVRRPALARPNRRARRPMLRRYP